MVWKLFFEKHPPIDKSLGYPAKYPRGCCAIVLDDGQVWDPGEHIGHAVSRLIVRAHNGELDQDGGVWRRELEARSENFFSAYMRAASAGTEKATSTNVSATPDRPRCEGR